MVLRQVKPASDARADPTPMRWAIIGITIAFLTLFVSSRWLNVFAQAFSKGLDAYFAAIGNPDALAAIELTLIVAAISVGLNLGVRHRRRLGHHQIRVCRQEPADHGDGSSRSPSLR
jgi:ABC-type sulfate transport system permease subunit